MSSFNPPKKEVMKEVKNYFHYTTRESLDKIIESGAINLATASTCHKLEKPVAWVSSNEQWEPTATKILVNRLGQVKMLTFDEQLQSVGCARIRVAAKGLYTWFKLKHKAKMNPFMALNMELVNNAEPKNWFGSLIPIKSNSWLCAEIFQNGRWELYKEFNA